MGNTYFKSGQWNVICNSCGCEKDVSEYLIHSNGKPRKQCKSCLYTRRKSVAKEVKLRSSRKYREKNYTLCLERSKEWRKNNLAYDAFRASTYRATKAQRTPSWANLDKIKEIYLNCPEGFHVDHIVPLRGTHASGLHVETNLQYLPAVENLRKRNLYGWV